MKSVLLSLSALIVTLLSINSVSAQSVKFHLKDPPTINISTIEDQQGNISFRVCISGTVYGCGNASSIDASFSLSGTADVLCFCKGNGTGQESGSVPGQNNFSVSSPRLTFNATNGHADFSLCVTIGGSCKGGGMDHFEVTNVDLLSGILRVNNKDVDLTSFLNQ